MDTSNSSMEVVSDGCWHHHEMSASDTSDIDDILINAIHSQVILRILMLMRIGMRISSHELREGIIGKFH